MYPYLYRLVFLSKVSQLKHKVHNATIIDFVAHMFSTLRG